MEEPLPLRERLKLRRQQRCDIIESAGPGLASVGFEDEPVVASPASDDDGGGVSRGRVGATSRSKRRRGRDQAASSPPPQAKAKVKDVKGMVRQPKRPKSKSQPAKNKALKRPPQLQAVELAVAAKGYDQFPHAALAGCVTVDAVLPDGETETEIGSGVCVSADGHILTAGHVAPAVGDFRRVGFASGTADLAVCIAVSEDYDLALLQLPKPRGKTKTKRPFPAVVVAAAAAPPKTKLVCVGQPGVRAKERLEANVGKVVSQCRDRLREQLDQGGGLVHSCPVYGGCSGAALLVGATAELVGIHTNFDHNKFESQAITLEAIREFLTDHGLAV